MNARVTGCFLTLLACLVAGNAMAKSASAPDAHGGQRYIVVLKEAPLAQWHSERNVASSSLQAAGNGKSAGGPPIGKLDAQAPESRAWLQHLDEEYGQFSAAAEQSLGRELKVVHRFRNALNGLSMSMTADEAERLAHLPWVKRVEVAGTSKLETDSGPQWIGADDIWSGVGFLPEARGEGIVVGIIDSGINWDHSSFDDPGEGIPPGNGAWDHVNPFGSELGLCSQDEVKCNDKLIGVYDFVTDDPDTEAEEENNSGLDNSGHGSHVASIAAGNPLNLSANGVPTQISGVAPNANIVSYRVCYIADPDDSDDDGCQNDAILEAIDQAISDGVDVVNYSIGSNSFSPWTSSSIPEAFLNLYGAGIFAATSAGNEGSGASTIGSPADAPWISAVGNATHDRVFASVVAGLSGGDTTPPEDMVGASFSDGISTRNIVHASDYGNALCGTGTPELQADCDSNTGATNPFAPGTFNGEIVVCDRGDYGRVEKGKNLLLAGAGGYILANTDEQGESIVADNHCLPASHIGDADGDELRTWLETGTGHQGRISGFTILRQDSAGDHINSSSSRGPNLSPAENVMKPNLIAPGTTILGAVDDGNSFAYLTGTSMASPHVTGAAALLLSVDDSWTPSMISSTLETTATAELAIDFDGSVATPHERGAGRPRLADAANAGLYLNESRTAFQAANPSTGGDPAKLNLSGLVNVNCKDSCSFTRTVTALKGGLNWTAAAVNFPEGVNVSVTPASFLLLSGQSRTLTINVDLQDSGQVGSWVYGNISLAASNMPVQQMTVAVYASGGDLPAEWFIASDEDSGSRDFVLTGLTSLKDATYTAGGLVKPLTETRALREDLTNDDPFDVTAGVFTVLRQVPEGALWLHAETLDSTAPDLDLFVGRDTNGDGLPQSSEQVCSSTSPNDLELCDIFNPPAGMYWIVVQNWRGSQQDTDDATLVTAVVDGEGKGLSATGAGVVAGGAAFPVRVSWSDTPAVTGEEWLGAVGIGTDRLSPANIGVIPVRFSRTGIASAKTVPLYDGFERRFAIRANGSQNRTYIDIPQGASSLTVSASGADGIQSDGLRIDLIRMPFDDAFGGAPFAANAPATTPAATASGSGGEGPTAVVSGGALEPGRWYALVRNTNGTPSSVAVRADVAFSGEPIGMLGGLWEPISRTGLFQGYEYSVAGIARAMIWYTYLEDGSPAWYLAANLPKEGNIWTADLLRFTNDGSEQQHVRVGMVSITLLDTDDAIFSFSLNGESGSDRMIPSAANTCATIDDQELSLIGQWYRGASGLGGATVFYNDFAHTQIHYLYDSVGNPRWLFGAEPSGNELSLLQFSGFCAVCNQGTPTYESIGTLTWDFTGEDTGSWTLDYLFNAPATGSVNRTDDIVKLTDRLACP